VNTNIDLGVPATTSWAKLRMRSDGTQVYFSVNGSTEQTISTANIGLNGATGASLYAEVTATGSASQTLSVDFFALKIQGLIR
jgi:hypothetical protein